MRFWPTREKRRKREEERQRADDAYEDERRQLLDALAGKGWQPAWRVYPDRPLVETTRDGVAVQVVNWNSVPPQLNMYGLWWRPHEGDVRGTIIEATANEVPANQLQIPSATGKERENE